MRGIIPQSVHTEEGSLMKLNKLAGFKLSVLEHDSVCYPLSVAFSVLTRVSVSEENQGGPGKI